jgi:pimeloyl-ACP methyl ester carboxylesterase
LHRVDGYSLERLTNDLVSFIEEVVAEPVDLLGHSMGGNIALRATLLRPELVRSLILMDTTAGSFQPRDPDIRAAFGSFVERFDPTRGMPELASRNTPEDELITQRTTEAWRNAKAELGRQFDPYAFKALATELFSETNSSVESRLGEIHRPTTVLVGSLDHPLVDVAPELAERVEAARLVVIDGAYHSPQLTHPHEWRRAVTDHLDR